MMPGDHAQDQQRQEYCTAHQPIQPIHKIHCIGAAQNPEQRQQRPKRAKLHRAKPRQRDPLQFKPAANRNQSGQRLRCQLQCKAQIPRVIPKGYRRNGERRTNHAEELRPRQARIFRLPIQNPHAERERHHNAKAAAARCWPAMA